MMGFPDVPVTMPRSRNRTWKLLVMFLVLVVPLVHFAKRETWVLGLSTDGPIVHDTKGVSMYHKKYYLGQYLILSYLLSRQVCSLTFKAGMIEPLPLAFKASEMSVAPLVPYYTSTVSQIWTGRWMGINPSYLSAHSMFTLEKKIIEFYTYPLCFCVI